MQLAITLRILAGASYLDMIWYGRYLFKDACNLFLRSHFCYIYLTHPNPHHPSRYGVRKGSIFQILHQMIILIDRVMPDKESFNFNPAYEGFNDQCALLAR
jgi:hypothetical protein